ncbi:MAG: hemerythrin, partial [Ignavibacteria bacterium]
MNKIEWKHYYNIGVPEIDEQHKKLTDMINELIVARNEGKEEEVFGKILKSLVEYTQVHFSSEEKHMKQYNYPGLVEHQHQHKALIGQ